MSYRYFLLKLRFLTSSQTIYKRSTLVYEFGCWLWPEDSEAQPKLGRREGKHHVQRRPASRQADPGHGRRHRAWQGNGGGLRGPWRACLYMWAAQGSAG